MMGTTWPDGKPLLEQPYRLKLAFATIGSVEAKTRKKPGVN